MTLAMIMSTYPNTDAAKSAARQAVEARLAACVNITPVSSVYRWKGDICNEDEVLAVFKTTKDMSEKLSSFILEGHPYDTPEIVKLDASSTGPYMDWLADSVSASQSVKAQ